MLFDSYISKYFNIYKYKIIIETYKDLSFIVIFLLEEVGLNH